MAVFYFTRRIWCKLLFSHSEKSKSVFFKNGIQEFITCV
ncbi:hypothetical protein NU08_0314 [Flavobacterium anhuiense]|uniref:Uncharacterized protein n=1 Tax=Flavobacterium anhuiense TaxID=459526 RepID=A0A444W4R8_9FLAO|nr:hypothetical protein NU08_0314 [Flavobacterium anhuiense]